MSDYPRDHLCIEPFLSTQRRFDQNVEAKTSSKQHYHNGSRWHTQHDWVGRTVEHAGFDGVLYGRVVKWLPHAALSTKCRGLWHVVYDDGREEHLNEVRTTSLTF